jgi:hypothetical protein
MWRFGGLQERATALQPSPTEGQRRRFSLRVCKPSRKAADIRQVNLGHVTKQGGIMNR